MKNKPYRDYIYLLLKVAIGLVQLLPRTVALGLARFLGWAAFILVSRQRNKTLTNLRTAFGHEKTEQEIRNIAKSVFQNLAMTLTDLIFLKKFVHKHDKSFIYCKQSLRFTHSLGHHARNENQNGASNLLRIE